MPPQPHRCSVADGEGKPKGNELRLINTGVFDQFDQLEAEIVLTHARTIK